MLNRILVAVGLVCLLYAGFASAQYNSFPPGAFSNRAALYGGGFNPSCTESSNFIARTSGQNDTHKATYDALICGGVSDGWWSKTDALYMLRAQDSTVILLNLVSSNFSLTAVGGITFTADVGVTGNGTTGAYKTGFIPSSAGGNFQQNAATIAFCSTATVADLTTPIGGFDLTQNAQMIAIAGNIQGSINNAAVLQTASTAGLWQITREASTTATLYKNAASQVTNATASAGNLTRYIAVLARNGVGGTDSLDTFTAINITMAMIGGGFTSTDVTNFRNRVATYMAAIGSAAC